MTRTPDTRPVSSSSSSSSSAASKNAPKSAPKKGGKKDKRGKDDDPAPSEDKVCWPVTFTKVLPTPSPYTGSLTAHAKKTRLHVFIRKTPAYYIRSHAAPIQITKDMYTQLNNHTKTVTRRLWNSKLVRAHSTAHHNRQLVRVWSRPDSGTLYGKVPRACKCMMNSKTEFTFYVL